MNIHIFWRWKDHNFDGKHKSISINSDNIFCVKYPIDIDSAEMVLQEYLSNTIITIADIIFLHGEPNFKDLNQDIVNKIKEFNYIIFSGGIDSKYKIIYEHIINKVCDNIQIEKTDFDSVFDFYKTNTNYYIYKEIANALTPLYLKLETNTFEHKTDFENYSNSFSKIYEKYQDKLTGIDFDLHNITSESILVFHDKIIDKLLGS